MTVAKQSKGLQIKLRTTTGLDAVKASRTMGASNSQLVVTAKTAGIAGNSITFKITNPGATTAEPVVNVVGTAIEVVAGYSTGAIDSNVNEIIAAIYASAAAAALIDATNGAGDGSGLIAAAGLANLTGGADGTHVYEEIPGVGDVTLPGQNRELLDVTAHDSVDDEAEFVKSKIKEGNDFSFPIFFNPTNSVHAALKAAEESDDPVYMQFIYPSSLGGFESATLVKSLDADWNVRGVVKATCMCRLTGARTAL